MRSCAERMRVCSLSLREASGIAVQGVGGLKVVEIKLTVAGLDLLGVQPGEPHQMMN